MTQQIPIFIINLERSAERRKKIEDQFNSIELNYEFYKAIDGRELDWKSIKNYAHSYRLKEFGKDMTPNEIGCYLSHFTLFERILNEGHEMALIIEDDVKITKELPAVLKAIKNVKTPWDMIRLASSRDRKFEILEPITEIADLVKLKGNACGAVGYILNQSGAEKLCNYCKTIFHPIDIAMDRVWENKLQIRAVYPFPIVHDNSVQSDIRSDSPPIQDPQKTIHKLRRKRRKIVDGINKRLWEFRSD
ncbi:glycosyltransferase family 25 protein [Kiloniella sp. EL199]|uniref:glycosyltransferase family 25 protein n=1 Tax=Kiloniella sp. EL199 TaxID=2107581 RepID=UPI000EA0FAB8|nr:glycosyltransferase family 25 protein [Kiloniella sp. EL199]